MAGYITLSLLVGLVVIGISIPFFFRRLAKKDVLYTEVPEGTAKAVMRAQTFDHFVMSLRGFYMNDPRARWFDPSFPEWEILPATPGQVFDTRGGLTRWLGNYFVGLPPFREVYRYRFAWSEMCQNAKGMKVVWARKEMTNVVFVTSFPYILTLEAAETKDKIPVTLVFQLTIRVVNPYKTLFDTENWYELVSGAAINAARNYVGSRSYEDLTSEVRAAVAGSADAANLFSTPLRELSKECPGKTPGLHELYGVEIERADPQTIDIAASEEEKAKILKSTLAVYVADQDAYAVERAGKATAAANLAIGTAAAEVTELQGKAAASAYDNRLTALEKHPEIAITLLQTDAMAAPGPGRTIVWANNPFVKDNSALLEALGVKSFDDLKERLGLPSPA